LNQPTPAIVAQDAVRRLPRVVLLLFCLAYVVPGFVGREPWKNADIMAFGYMFEMARGASSWLAPTLLGQPPEFDALLPYWLGAWAMQFSPGWIAPDLAARVPFVLLLLMALFGTWYGVYYLARSPQAQPVPFAFGGEAHPTDYARALADGGLLALIACLGLAQLSHETTPALAQVAFTSLSFYAIAALPRRPAAATLWLFAGMAGLALSGAPAMAMLFSAGGLVISLLDRDPRNDSSLMAPWTAAAILAAALLATAALAWGLDLWRWRISPMGLARDWRARPARAVVHWPAGRWHCGRWRWRRQLGSRHVAAAVVRAGRRRHNLVTPSDRSLLLACWHWQPWPSRFPRSAAAYAALIDWFTLLFFSGCASSSG
jgi:hypothetical protein